MANDISLTVRLPKELSINLKTSAKRIGMTKTNLIRSTIHELAKNKSPLEFSEDSASDRDRMVLNVNQITYDILEGFCQQYNQSMNAVVTAVCVEALKNATRWIQLLEQ